MIVGGGEGGEGNKALAIRDIENTELTLTRRLVPCPRCRCCRYWLLHRCLRYLRHWYRGYYAGHGLLPDRPRLSPGKAPGLL